MRKKMDRKLIQRAVMALGLAVLLCGCGVFTDAPPIEETEEMEEAEDLIEVGFSQIGSESVWRTANTVSIQNALTKQNGYFLIFNNARQKQENQIKAIRSFISQRVDYIVFSPVTEDGWDTVLGEAKDAGIPVILVDRMVSVDDDSLYTTWIGTDAKQEGLNAGKWLEDYQEQKNCADEELNIVVLQGTTGSSAQLGRTMGFDTVADRHDNWHILAQENADFTTAKGKEIMQKFMRQYDDIDVVVSQNDDMTFGALEAINQAGYTTGDGGDMILISFDAVHDALELVNQGVINVDIECNPEQGDYVAEVIEMLERGESVEKKYTVEEKVFTIKNVSGYLDNRSY